MSVEWYVSAQIQVLLMDVDGTMTAGGVTLLSQTEEIALEIKTFDAHDGQGLTLAHTAGLLTGCAESLTRLQMTGANKGLFTVTDYKLNLLEEERRVPGREIAYVLSAKAAFQK